METANAAFTGSITGLVAGDIITGTYASGATTTTPVGVYSSGLDVIAATLSDPGNKLGDYTLTQNVGTLTITQATAVLTWSNPRADRVMERLSARRSSTLRLAAWPALSFTPPAGTGIACWFQSPL